MRCWSGEVAYVWSSLVFKAHTQHIYDLLLVLMHSFFNPILVSISFFISLFLYSFGRSLCLISQSAQDTQFMVPDHHPIHFSIHSSHFRIYSSCLKVSSGFLQSWQPITRYCYWHWQAFLNSTWTMLPSIPCSTTLQHNWRMHKLKVTTISQTRVDTEVWGSLLLDTRYVLCLYRVFKADIMSNLKLLL